MRIAATTAAILMLAACSSGGGSGNEQAPANEAGAAAGGEAGASDTGGAGGGAASLALQAGEWETTVQVTSMSMPNMPQGATTQTPPPTTIRSCITPEQAARPNANFLTGTGETGGCNFENFSMAGGRLQGAVTCNAQGTTMRSTFEGQFTATSYEMTTQVESNAGGMAMNMATRTTARRVGDCPAG
jgi:hypothetical protein